MKNCQNTNSARLLEAHWVDGDSTSAVPANVAAPATTAPKPAAGGAKKKKGASGGCG
ncbi:MAG: hypothetical protein ACOYLE_00795 [Bacteroidales bacterium]